jgi:hypothetical protein
MLFASATESALGDADVDANLSQEQWFAPVCLQVLLEPHNDPFATLTCDAPSLESPKGQTSDHHPDKLVFQGVCHPGGR